MKKNNFSDFQYLVAAQQTFTCSNSTIKTLERGVNLFKVYNKDTRTTSMTSFRCLYCLLWTYLTHFCTDSIIAIDYVSVCWLSRLTALSLALTVLTFYKCLSYVCQI